MTSVSDRWASFDCYGTLVDWNAGIGAELERLLGEADREQLLARYHEIEPRIQRKSPELSYREVMAATLTELAAERGFVLPEHERGALARAQPPGPGVPAVPGALTEARARGWKLVALSNSDRDLIDASLTAIGVPFEDAVVAGEIRSYKPAHRHWEAFYERTGADPRRHVHVAQSHFHDIAPPAELGIPTIWINRLGERATPAPTRELADLAELADSLDELVPPDGSARSRPGRQSGG